MIRRWFVAVAMVLGTSAAVGAGGCFATDVDEGGNAAPMPVDAAIDTGPRPRDLSWVDSLCDPTVQAPCVCRPTSIDVTREGGACAEQKEALTRLSNYVSSRLSGGCLWDDERPPGGCYGTRPCECLRLVLENPESADVDTEAEYQVVANTLRCVLNVVQASCPRSGP